MALDSPHDALFKEIFSQPELAKVELRAVLPSALCAKVDWDTLRVLPGSFVEVRDRDRFADLLYGVRIAETDAFLYLLFEHQSSPDRFMALRLLGYLLRKWEQIRRDSPALPSLPPIIPIVLHHGALGWADATSFQDLFAPGLLEALGIAGLVPDFRFVLDDLSTKSDAELMARAAREGESIVPVVLWALRDARTRDRLLLSFAAWAGALGEVLRAPSGKEALLAVFSYISRVTDPYHPVLSSKPSSSPPQKPRTSS